MNQLITIFKTNKLTATEVTSSSITETAASTFSNVSADI